MGSDSYAVLQALYSLVCLSANILCSVPLNSVDLQTDTANALTKSSSALATIAMSLSEQTNFLGGVLWLDPVKC